MVKAVILDYGGTLVDTDLHLDILSEKVVERLLLDGVEIAANDFHNAFLDTVEWRKTVNAKGREIDGHEFFSHIVETFGYDAGRDLTDEIEMLLMGTGETIWLGDIEKLLVQLSEEYKVALLSNAWLEAPRQILRDEGFGRWFDAMVCSFDIGIPKPDPRIFQHTLNLLGVNAHEAVMVGDSIKADIEGALNARLEAVWVDHNGTGEWKGNTIRSLVELPELLKKL